jgi:hypothetical protein
MVLSGVIYLGIVADLEGLAISMVLPRWRADARTILHAFKLRQIRT